MAPPAQALAPKDDERDQYTEDPHGWAMRWEHEFASSKKEVAPWHSAAERVLARFRDERKHDETGGLSETRWNLFTANIQTQRCLLYGKTPKVDVSRKFGDANDDQARVAAEMLERLLNCDIQRDSDTYAFALECALDDRLLVGLGNARVRYEAEFETQEVEAQTNEEGIELAEGYSQEEKKHEDVQVDYLHWKDQLWSAGARTFSEVRWWGFRAQMNRRDLVKRFGQVGQDAPLNSKTNLKSGDGRDVGTPWDRADVWEIWSKDDRAVFWFIEGFDKTLDMKPDPLGLDGFWPFPRPMAANLTTSTLIPRPDFVIAQDLYNEIDNCSARITRLIEALRVVGVYDKKAGNLMTLLKGRENEMVPVDNWAMFSEKGGFKGVVDWFPLDQVASTVSALRDYRSECVAALYQITGMSDIMRGEATQGGVTATEQGIKARFASVRMQAMQDEFARFASDLQKLKAEIISKLFEPKTIIERSNVMYTADAQLAVPATQLIKSRFAHYRVEVKPEAVNLTDYAQMKAERTEFLLALSTFLSASAPLAQQMPSSMPHLLEMLKWTMAGMRGSSTIEGVLDRAIASAQQQAQQPQAAPPPDPKVQAQQLKLQGDAQKAQSDMQKEQFKFQADMAHLQAETQAKAEQEKNQAIANISEARAKHALVRSGSTPAFSPGAGP